MNMVSKGSKRKYRYKDTFKFAFEGIYSCFKQEKNLRFHFIFSILVVFLGILLSLSKVEWLFILFAIAGMIVMEMVNSSIERVVDLVTDSYHPLAKQAKDIAAGAVLIYAFLSVIIGIMIFLPKIIRFF